MTTTTTQVVPAAIPAAALLTRQGLADYLGVDVSTLWRWHVEGKPLPPSLRLGSKLRWRVSTVDAWLAELESQEAA